MTMRLPLRLFLSYAAVAVIGAAVAYLTVRLLAPQAVRSAGRHDERLG